MTLEDIIYQGDAVGAPTGPRDDAIGRYKRSAEDIEVKCVSNIRTKRKSIYNNAPPPDFYTKFNIKSAGHGDDPGPKGTPGI